MTSKHPECSGGRARQAVPVSRRSFLGLGLGALVTWLAGCRRAAVPTAAPSSTAVTEAPPAPSPAPGAGGRGGGGGEPCPAHLYSRAAYPHPTTIPHP
jgi:hypothetical protein